MKLMRGDMGTFFVLQGLFEADARSLAGGAATVCAAALAIAKLKIPYVRFSSTHE